MSMIQNLRNPSIILAVSSWKDYLRTRRLNGQRILNVNTTNVILFFFSRSTRLLRNQRLLIYFVRSSTVWQKCNTQVRKENVETGRKHWDQGLCTLLSVGGIILFLARTCQIRNRHSGNDCGECLLLPWVGTMWANRANSARKRKILG